MPVYSYKCEKCGKIFDRFQKVDEGSRSNNMKCIYCNSNALRLFSSVGIIFKGSGFYTTDYKSSSMNLNNGSASKVKGKELKESGDKTSNKKETSKKEADTVSTKPAES